MSVSYMCSMVTITQIINKKHREKKDSNGCCCCFVDWFDRFVRPVYLYVFVLFDKSKIMANIAATRIKREFKEVMKSEEVRELFILTSYSKTFRFFAVFT